MAADSGRGISPLAAEAWALRLAIMEAAKLGIEYLLLESDSIIVTDAVSGVGRCPWEIDMMISEIRIVLQRFKGVQIRHIFREANRTADKLARLHQQLPVETIKHHPEFITLVHSDAIGCGFNL